MKHNHNERSWGSPGAPVLLTIMLGLLLPQVEGVGLPPGYLANNGTVRAEWTYADKDKWATQFVQHCAGNMQSPVNLDRFNSQYDIIFPMVFSNYDVAPTKQTATNDGHTVKVTYTATKPPQISYGNLPDKGPYTLAQYHLHWGADATKGSEHTINSVRYPMELHLVHYKTAYGSLTDSIDKADGLAVLGIMFELSDTDNANLKPLIDVISSITTKDQSADKTTNNPYQTLLPSDTRSFYRYKGGLTTPTCNEIVTWTVFREPIGVSAAQLTTIRTLKDKDGVAITDNFRDPQPINQRTIYRTFI